MKSLLQTLGDREREEWGEKKRRRRM